MTQIKNIEQMMEMTKELAPLFSKLSPEEKDDVLQDMRNEMDILKEAIKDTPISEEQVQKFKKEHSKFFASEDEIMRYINLLRDVDKDCGTDKERFFEMLAIEVTECMVNLFKEYMTTEKQDEAEKILALMKSGTVSSTTLSELLGE